VRARRRGFEPSIRWNLHGDDLKVLADAMWVLAQIFFAAGARSILPGVHRLPDECRRWPKPRCCAATTIARRT
jgi:hypothetical protein